MSINFGAEGKSIGISDDVNGIVVSCVALLSLGESCGEAEVNVSAGIIIVDSDYILSGSKLIFIRCVTLSDLSAFDVFCVSIYYFLQCIFNEVIRVVCASVKVYS